MQFCCPCWHPRCSEVIAISYCLLHPLCPLLKGETASWEMMTLSFALHILPSPHCRTRYSSPCAPAVCIVQNSNFGLRINQILFNTVRKNHYCAHCTQSLCMLVLNCLHSLVWLLLNCTWNVLFSLGHSLPTFDGGATLLSFSLNVCVTKLHLGSLSLHWICALGGGQARWRE